MARIRSVKPAFFSSLDIARHPDSTRLHFIGLWTYADDAGRGIDDPRLIKAALWPLDDVKTIRKVEQMQKSLADGGLIERYKVGGQAYFRVVKWDHQRIDKKQPSKLPPSPNEPSSTPAHSTNGAGSVDERSGNDPGTIREGSRLDRKGEERRGEEGKSSSSSGHPAAAADEPVDDDDRRGEDPEPSHDAGTEAAIEAAIDDELADRLSDRVVAKEGQVRDVAAWRAGSRKRVLVRLAEGGLDAIRPGPPAANGAHRPDPLEASAAAQRAIAERNEARLRGEFECQKCSDAGVFETEGGVVERCDCVASTPKAAVR